MDRSCRLFFFTFLGAFVTNFVGHATHRANFVPTGYVNVRVVGILMPNDGIGQIAAHFVRMFSNCPGLRVSFHQTRSAPHGTDWFKDKVSHTPISGLKSVTVYCDGLYKGALRAFDPVRGDINIAYSVLESTKIPQFWVKTLNEKFDAVVVPDEYLLNVYRGSGVRIPVFALAHPAKLDDLLALPIKRAAEIPFTFGCSAAFGPKKNFETLVQAFTQEFGNNERVCLRLHGRFGEPGCVDKIRNEIVRSGCRNIELIEGVLTRAEYVDFLRSLDCYVLISKGEGYSVTPRESCALGLPCILTDQSAQHTICLTGLVRNVRADIPEPAHYDFCDEDLGYFWGCRVEDVRAALRDVFQNYNLHVGKAAKRREWVRQYTWENLRPYYHTLARPSRIILGAHNEIGQGVITTDSLALAEKYHEILGSKL